MAAVVQEEVCDSVEWGGELCDVQGITYFWNRRTHMTRWKPPPGIRVVWVGERLSEGVFFSGTGTPVPCAMTSLLFLLSDAAGVRGLASPHAIIGAYLVLSRWLGLLFAPRFWQSLFLVSYLRRLADSSGCCASVFSAFWFDSGYMLRQFTKSWGISRFLREDEPRILRYFFFVLLAGLFLRAPRI